MLLLAVEVLAFHPGPAFALGRHLQRRGLGTGLVVLEILVALQAGLAGLLVVPAMLLLALARLLVALRAQLLWPLPLRGVPVQLRRGRQ